MKAKGGNTRPANSLNALLIRSGQGHQSVGCVGGLGGGFGDTREEKAQPGLPITRQPHRLEQFVIPFAVLFQVKTEIKQWLPQRPFSTEQNRDEQPPKSPVAIQEWMDGFELHMGQSGFDEQGSL